MEDSNILCHNQNEKKLYISKNTQSATQSQPIDHILEDQIIFEKLLSRSAQDFLNEGLSGFSNCVDTLITELRSLFGVDWGFSWKNNDAICGMSTHSFADRKAADIDLNHFINESVHNKCMEAVRSGRMLIVSDYQKERTPISSLLPENIRSFIIAPVFRENDLWGIIGMFSFQTQRMWTMMEIYTLKTAANIIMSAYNRAKLEKQLSESNRVLVDYDDCLQDILAVQEALSTVAAQYLASEPKDFSSCTNNMLETLCELTNLDLACIQVVADKSHEIYNWHKKGFLLSYPRMDSTLLSKWGDFLLGADHFAINDISDISTCIPTFVQDTMLSMGLRSVLMIPVHEGDSLYAILFLSKILGCRDWNNALIETAKQFSSVFFNAHIRMRQNAFNTTALKKAITNEVLFKKVAECILQLSDVTEENLLTSFRLIFNEISSLIPILSICLSQFSPDYSEKCIVFGWHTSGPLSIRNSNFLNRDEQLSIPIYHRKVIWGSLSVDFCSQPSDSFSYIFEMLGNNFVNAYMHIHKNDTGNTNYVKRVTSSHTAAI